MSSPADSYRASDPRRPEDMLRRHLARTGGDIAARTDPYAKLQLSVLRDILAVVRAACDDEGLDPVTTHRILDRVIYGCVPSRAASEHRLQIIANFDAEWGRVVPKPVWPPR